MALEHRWGTLGDYIGDDRKVVCLDCGEEEGTAKPCSPRKEARGIPAKKKREESLSQNKGDERKKGR